MGVTDQQDKRQQDGRKREAVRLLQPISALGLKMLNSLSATFFCSMFWLWLLYSFSSQCTGCVCVCECMCVCWREGVALLLQFSLSARFFNFTPHFPLMSFSHTHPLIFMGNRQAAVGLSVALLSPAGMQDHRRYSSERTRGGGITNDSLKFGFVGGGKATGKTYRF